MDATTIIDNLISAIEGGDADDIKETVALARLLAPGLQAPTPVGTHYVYDETDMAIIGSFPDEASAMDFCNVVLDGIGNTGIVFSKIDDAADYAQRHGVTQVAPPAQPNLPAGYVSTKDSPGARLSLKPPGTIYS